MEAREQCLTHLGQLADKLAGYGFTTELASKIAKPHLKVANATTPSLNERVLCQPADDGSWSFWWPWNQPIGSVDDLELVVNRIALVLRSLEAER
jgi:hypothetical protein